MCVYVCVSVCECMYVCMYVCVCVNCEMRKAVNNDCHNSYFTGFMMSLFALVLCLEFLNIILHCINIEDNISPLENKWIFGVTEIENHVYFIRKSSSFLILILSR